jgi:hypothetical protein
MDLIRDILLLAQAAPAGREVGDFSTLTSDRETVVEHVWLLREAILWMRT